MDREQAFRWLGTYCKNHPLSKHSAQLANAPWMTLVARAARCAAICSSNDDAIARSPSVKTYCKNHPLSKHSAQLANAPWMTLVARAARCAAICSSNDDAIA